MTRSSAGRRVASTRSRIRARDVVGNRRRRSAELERRRAVVGADDDRCSSTVVGADQSVEPAEVHGPGGLGRERETGAALISVGTPVDIAAARKAAARPPGLEQRWVDPLGQQRGLLECALEVSCHVVEELDGGTRIALDELARELNVDRKSDEVLLRAVVELALEGSTLGVIGERDALTRGTKLVDLEASRSSASSVSTCESPTPGPPCFEG